VPAVRKFVRFGASPRAVQALVLAGKVRALMAGRYNVAFEDLRAATPPALRHRVFLNFEADAAGVTTDSLLEQLLEAIAPEPVAA
jgi:MoxR-like ATPase